MTSGEASGTSGGKTGTGGWRLEWPPVAAIALVGLVVAAINATSGMIEVETGMRPPARTAEVWLWELSSVVMVVALSPLVSWAVWKVPPPGGFSAPAWARALGLHLVAACGFSVVHVAGMVAIREAGYAAAGSDYDFAYQGDLAMPFLYEWRKDLLTYASNAFVFWGWGFLQAQRAAQTLVASGPGADGEARGDARIEIRDGARISLIDPAAIDWVEAAGNYVEIHMGVATHLARGTLAGFEQRLAPHGFVRVHRSRLVNRARIAAFRPTPSGDLEITLDDGRVVAGSRRFRSALGG